MRPRVTFAALLAACLTISAAAQQTAPPFRVERPVTTVSGPQRLAIDVPLLAGAAPFSISGPRARPIATGGLSDLRFFDGAGHEVPYLLVHPPGSEPVWERGTVLPVLATRKTSGFEVDFGEPLTMDAIRVGGLRPPFLKRFVLEGSGDRQHWTMLAPEGTLFDLPDEDLQQTHLPFAAGSYRYLRVTWDDTNSGRLGPPPQVDARRVAAAAPPPALLVPVAIERRPSEPGRSRYHLRLPAARLPIVGLELHADGGHVFRDATVFQPRLVEHEAVPSQVGTARLRRIVRDGMSAGTLRIPLSGVTEPELDLVIEDGANPPLAIRSATVTCAELPWIYFESRAGTLTARYGNATAASPSYDLEAVRERVTLTGLPEARWGEPRAWGADTSPATSPLPERGAGVEVAGFRHVRALPAGDARLVALTLDAAALAHSRGPSAGFADVRVIDPENRQVPYLLERRDEPMPIELTVAPAQASDEALRARTGPSWSSYRIELPYAPLPAARLVVETSARVFRRNVRLLVERAPDRRRRDRAFDVLASETWTYASEHDAAPALTLQVPSLETRTIVLSVDEGDNERLPLGPVRLLLPSYRLRFYRPENTPLRVAYGRSDLSLPRYDLALLAPHVLGLDAHEIAAAPETSPAAGPPVTLISARMFWLLLGAAVVVLLAIIARLIVKA